MISIIAAVALDGAIGRQGGLVCHIREDMRHFRRLTMGHPVVMGRKTFESLPGGALPGRRNVVVTRNSAYHAEGIETFPSLEQAIQRLRADSVGDADTEIFIIGGGEIYRQVLPFATRLYLTQIDASFADADTHFPEVNPAQWHLDDASEWSEDAQSGIRYRMVCLSRN